MQKREDFGSDTRVRDNSKNQIVKWISDNNGNRKKNVSFERKRGLKLQRSNAKKMRNT